MTYKNKQTEVFFEYRDDYNMLQKKTMLLDGILNAFQAEDILINQYGFKIEKVYEPSKRVYSWYTIKRTPIMHSFSYVL